MTKGNTISYDTIFHSQFDFQMDFFLFIEFSQNRISIHRNNFKQVIRHLSVEEGMINDPFSNFMFYRPTYVQQVRMVAMQFIQQNDSIKQIRDLKNIILSKNEEFYKVRYFNKSHHHSLKLRYTQALAFLFRLDPTWDDRLLQFILKEANQTNVKYICEMIVADTMKPNQLFPIIEKVMHKISTKIRRNINLEY